MKKNLSVRTLKVKTTAVIIISLLFVGLILSLYIINKPLIFRSKAVEIDAINDPSQIFDIYQLNGAGTEEKIQCAGSSCVLKSQNDIIIKIRPELLNK